MAQESAQQRRTAEPTKAGHNAAPSGRQAANGPTASRKTSGQSGTSKSSSSKDKGDRDPKMIGPWRIGRTIGKGSSGALSCFSRS